MPRFVGLALAAISVVLLAACSEAESHPIFEDRLLDLATSSSASAFKSCLQENNADAFGAFDAHAVHGMRGASVDAGLTTSDGFWLKVYEMEDLLVVRGSQPLSEDQLALVRHCAGGLAD